MKTSTLRLIEQLEEEVKEAQYTGLVSKSVAYNGWSAIYDLYSWLVKE